jgi:predicted dehydrogenase
MSAKQSQIRLGLIGLGMHARENLLPALRLADCILLSGISSRNADNLNAASIAYNIPFKTTDWKQLVNKEIVDGVVVSATPGVHSEVFHYAAEQNVHVFCEKPPAPDLTSLQLICEKVGDCKIISFVDYNFRFSEGFKLLSDVLEDDGSIKCIKIRFLNAKPQEPLWGMKTLARSYIYAVAIHAIELAISVIGEVEEIIATAIGFNGQNLAINASVHSSSGKVAFLELGNYSNRFDCRIEAITQGGTVGVLSGLRQLQVFNSKSFLDRKYRFSGKEVGNFTVSDLKGGYSIGGYEGAIRSFCNSIIENSRSLSDVKLSLPVYQVAERILTQIKEDNL